MKLILGLGLTGRSMVRFLSKQGWAYRLADSRANPPLLDDCLAEFSNFSPILGAWTEDLLTDVDEIFISPGIAQNETIVVWALQKNIPIVSDIELFSRFAKAPIIGITGSNGKSTVATLLADMIKKAGFVVQVGGNIGKPALDCLAPKVEFYVLELSSYQLDYTQKLNLLTGVVLNIVADHLDRYHSFKMYANSKLKLYQFCQNKVINRDEVLIPKDYEGKYFGLEMPKNKADFGTVTCHEQQYLLKGDHSLMATNQALLLGKHNIQNILAALSLGDEIGLETEPMIASIGAFSGLEHRLEWVVKKQNIDYYNDSKATNSSATIAAINTLLQRHKTNVLIIGGIKKQEDYTALFTLINARISAVVLIGQCATEFGKALKIPKKYASSMLEAVNCASTMIKKGAVLLSPACASFDMFADFEARGKAFKSHI